VKGFFPLFLKVMSLFFRAGRHGRRLLTPFFSLLIDPERRYPLSLLVGPIGDLPSRCPIPSPFVRHPTSKEVKTLLFSPSESRLYQAVWLFLFLLFLLPRGAPFVLLRLYLVRFFHRHIPPLLDSLQNFLIPSLSPPHFMEFRLPHM